MRMIIVKDPTQLINLKFFFIRVRLALGDEHPTVPWAVKLKTMARFLILQT